MTEEGTSSSLLRSGNQQTSQQSVPLPNSARSCNIESLRSQFQQDSVREHRRLFGFQPSKSYTKKGKGRQKVLQKPQPTKSKWWRDCICLCETDQTCKPTPEEKMKLAKMGLGLKEIVFDSDGSADHVHEKLLGSYPVLRDCGGYTLLRLGSGSKSLVEIEGPQTGITVPYLKDILNQAKLYIRPLQSDICEDDVDPYMGFKVSLCSVGFTVTVCILYVHSG